jgi:hypothetical protein
MFAHLYKNRRGYLVNRYKEQLKRHLGFISRSCELYDEGINEEAIRIGTSLRVLLHDHGRSVSLLNHLHAKESIKLLTTVRAHAPTLGGSYDGLTVLSPTKLRMTNPALGAGNFRDFIPVKNWWEQVVFARDGSLMARRDVILTSTNKDGGAHIDSDVGPLGRVLMEGVFWTDGLIGGRSVDLGNSHFLALRQFGFEMLESNELLALAQ